MRKKQERLYKIYVSIKYRYRNNLVDLSQEWIDSYQEFKKWSYENQYTDSKKLFRIDTSLGYFKENCAWAQTVQEVRKAKGRKKFACIKCSANKATRRDTMCRECASINARKNPKYDVKKYRRNWSLIKKYGISLEDFNLMFLNQNNRCLICNCVMQLPKEQMGQGMDVVAIDHDHKTGQVRGLLCNSCNKGLGHFKDDKKILSKAIKYLGDIE